jgi:SET domain-containing protein
MIKIKEHLFILTEGQKKQGNIAGFINSTRPATTNKQPNCVFEGHEGNHVFICAIKSIVAGEELLIDYNLNQVDTYIAIMREVHILFYPTCKQ